MHVGTFEIQLSGEFIVLFIESTPCDKYFRFCFQMIKNKDVNYTAIKIFTFPKKWILPIFTIEIE